MSDDAFENYLRGGSALSRAYRDAADELPAPAPATDAAILAAARREVGARPTLAHSPFSRSWYVPLSLAAVLVLSITLTLVLERSDEADITPSASAPVRQDATTIAPIPSDEAARLPAQSDTAAAQVANGQTGGPETQRSVPEAAVLAPAPVPGKAAEPRPSARAETRSKLADAKRQKADEFEARREEIAQAPEAFPASAMPASPATQTGDAPIAERAPQEAKIPPAPALPAAVEAPVAEPEPVNQARHDSMAREEAASAPEAAVQSDASDQHSSPLRERSPALLKSPPARVTGAVGTARRAESEAAPDQRAVTAGISPQGAQSAVAEAPPQLAQERLPPADWIQKILTLQRQGKIAEARVQLRKFLEAHPGYALPEELKVLRASLTKHE